MATEIYERFIVFADHEFYPGGGMPSSKSSFKTLDEAMIFAKQEETKGLMVEVFDCDGRKVVYQA